MARNEIETVLNEERHNHSQVKPYRSKWSHIEPSVNWHQVVTMHTQDQFYYFLQFSNASSRTFETLSFKKQEKRFIFHVSLSFLSYSYYKSICKSAASKFNLFSVSISKFSPFSTHDRQSSLLCVCFDLLLQPLSSARRDIFMTPSLHLLRQLTLSSDSLPRHYFCQFLTNHTRFLLLLRSRNYVQVKFS